MARGRVTSSVKRCGAEAPQLCSIIPPGLDLRPSVGSSGHPRKDDPTGCRRGSWVGDRFAPQQRMQGKEFTKSFGDRRGHGEERVRGVVTRLDVVWGRVTSPDKREVWVRVPHGGDSAQAEWPVLGRASSSQDRAPNVPGRMFPSSSF